MQYSEVCSEGSTSSVCDDSHGMRESSTGGPENKEAWVRLLVLPLFCLRKTLWKGKAGKLRLSSVNQQQIAAFNRGEYTLPVGTKSPFLPPKNDNGKLILENLDQGDMRGAVRLAANDDTFTRPSEETLQKLQ